MNTSNFFDIHAVPLPRFLAVSLSRDATSPALFIPPGACQLFGLALVIQLDRSPSSACVLADHSRSVDAKKTPHSSWKMGKELEYRIEVKIKTTG